MERDGQNALTLSEGNGNSQSTGEMKRGFGKERCHALSFSIMILMSFID